MPYIYRDSLSGRAATATLEVAGGQTTLGRFNDYTFDLAGGFGAFHLKGETRSARFGEAFEQMVKNCTGVGAIAGIGMTWALDLFIGSARPKAGNYLSEGLVGTIAHVGVDIAAGASMPAGFLLGGASGLIPAACVGLDTCIADDGIHSGDKTALKVLKTFSTNGATAMGTTVAVGTSIPVGLALAGARLPSALIKGILTLAGAAVGVVFGFFAGCAGALMK